MKPSRRKKVPRSGKESETTPLPVLEVHTITYMQTLAGDMVLASVSPISYETLLADSMGYVLDPSVSYNPSPPLPRGSLSST